jgi:para-nitrobenzyl esterase
MPYLFGNIDKGGRSPFHYYRWADKDYAFMRQVMDRWYNFAKNGDPNSEGLAAWNPYKNDYDVMTLGNDSRMTDQQRVKSIYDYYMSILMKNIYGSSMPYMISMPVPAA